jgi:hypothetical protein
VNTNFQEEIPLKLKSLVVITLLVLGCSAAFGQVSLGFLSNTGGLQYCDYEVLTGPPTGEFAAGVHNAVTVCGFPNNGVMAGFKATIPVSSGLPVTGPIYQLADNTFDSQSGAYTGCQLEWITKTKAMAKKNPKFGWEFLDTCDGVHEYLGNYGYLTTQLGARASHSGTPKASFAVAKR